MVRLPMCVDQVLESCELARVIINKSLSLLCIAVLHTLEYLLDCTLFKYFWSTTDSSKNQCKEVDIFLSFHILVDLVMVTMRRCGIT